MSYKITVTATAKDCCRNIWDLLCSYQGMLIVGGLTQVVVGQTPCHESPTVDGNLCNILISI